MTADSAAFIDPHWPPPAFMVKGENMHEDSFRNTPQWPDKKLGSSYHPGRSRQFPSMTISNALSDDLLEGYIGEKTIFSTSSPSLVIR